MIGCMLGEDREDREQESGISKVKPSTLAKRLDGIPPQSASNFNFKKIESELS